MTCGIALTESVTSLGKCTKLQLNNKGKVGFSQPCFFIAEIFSTFFQKPLDNVATMWYNSVANRYTKGGQEMSKKVKIHISLANEIYEKGKEEADKLGIPFSTYLSVLIANDTKIKNEKRK